MREIKTINNNRGAWIVLGVALTVGLIIRLGIGWWYSYQHEIFMDSLDEKKLDSSSHESTTSSTRETLETLPLTKEPDFSSREFLTSVASEMNKAFPQMVDKETMITGTSALEGVLIYRYKLVNWDRLDLDINRFTSIMRPGNLNQNCTTEDLNVFFEHGVTLRHVYYDKNNLYITKIDVTPADCKKIGL